MWPSATQRSASRSRGAGFAGGLRIAQSHQTAQGPTIVLAALVDDEGVAQDYGLSFAGTLFVSWPLDAHLFWVAVSRFAEYT